MEENSNQEIILPNINTEPISEEVKDNNMDNINKVNIPAWDLTPPLDSVDRGQMN